ncbi:MAG: RHS repeat protein [Thermoflexus sp.]|nr:RHS repeat protein [Thermoflexus sp.]
MDPAGNTAEFGYDDRNNQIAITYTLGNVTRLTYNGWGRLQSVTDATGAVVCYGYGDGNGSSFGRSGGRTSSLAACGGKPAWMPIISSSKGSPSGRLDASWGMCPP